MPTTLPSTEQSLLLGLLGLGVFGVLLVLLRHRALLKGTLFMATTGLGALAAVNLSGAYTGISIALNPGSVAVAGLLGLPGVVSMLALRLLWGL